MTPALWIAVIAAAVFVIALLLLWPKLKRGTFKIPGASVDLETHKPSGPESGGATMEDVRAGGSARNVDGTGKGAAMRRIDAVGDVENINGADGGGGGWKRPKR